MEHPARRSKSGQSQHSRSTNLGGGREMYKHLKWAYRLALTAAFVSVGGRVAAQTPEGTVITNTATATYTDANTNSYAAVSGSVDVTVGFLPGVAVTSITPNQAPASPSTGDELTFTVQNAGNGTDTLSISENISDAAVMLVDGYRYASNVYTNLANLNTALSGAAVALNGSIAIDVLYHVPPNQGGVNTIYTLTAASRRTPTTSDNDSSSVTPAQTFCVGTCGGSGSGGGGQIYVGGADSILQVWNLPGNAYTVTFVIENGGNGTDSYDLVASIPGAVIQRVSVNGVAFDSTRITLAATTTALVQVVYNVNNVLAGSQDSLYLRVRSVGDTSLVHHGIMALTVVKP